MFIENKEYEPFALEFKRCYKELISSYLRYGMNMILKWVLAILMLSQIIQKKK